MGILEDIQNLKIQGAIEVALAKLEYLEEYGKEKGFGQNFMKEISKVEEIRNTAVVSHNVLEELKKNPSLESIRELKEELSGITEKVSKRFYDLVKNRDRLVVMTHCHSSEVVQSLIHAHNMGVKMSVFVTETRPAEQGITTSQELSEAGINVEFIVDSADAFFMGKSDIVVVGSDSLTKDGVVNKIGTFSMSIVARQFRRPFIVLSSKWKIDTRQKTEIELRPPEEIEKVEEEYDRGIAEGTALNPAFDITPWNNVSVLVTEDRTVFRPGWEDVI